MDKCDGRVRGIAWLYVKYDLAQLAQLNGSLRKWLRLVSRLFDTDPMQAASLHAWALDAVGSARSAADDIERSVEANTFVPPNQKLVLRCLVDGERDRLRAVAAEFCGRLHGNSVSNFMHVLRCTSTTESGILRLPTELLVRIVSLLDGQFVFVLRDAAELHI
jgi:hypothetical protein